VRAEITRCESVSTISRTTSSIACRFSHDSTAGSSAASMTKEGEPPLSIL
jgi:hypothetical protein